MNAEHNPHVVTDYDDDEISLLDLAQTLADNLRLLVAGPLAVGVLTLGVSFLMPPQFTASASVMPPESSGGGLSGQLGSLAGIAGISIPGGGGGKLVMAFLNSNRLKDRLIDDLGLMARWELEYREQARKQLQAVMKISDDKKSGLIKIEVTDKSAEFAAKMANRSVELLQETMDQHQIDLAREQRELLEQQIDEATKRPFQSPLVREATVQGLLRQFEMERLKETGSGSQRLSKIDLAQTPELKSGPKRGLMAVLATLATGFALVLFVFVRQALNNASQDPETANKLQQLRAAWRRAISRS